MNIGEAAQRISQMPPEMIGYMLMTYQLRHPEEFEQVYLDGAMIGED